VHGVVCPSEENLSSLSSLTNPDNALASLKAGVARVRENGLPEVHVVCLGIGKINDSRESQYQFLHLQDLASFFEVSF
jgi:hypothetical protein